ncbi:MAG: DEAD/DEAH box helicase [Alphaproteobacteria bacterium]|nr:DEAD/DEAH box helicase [Alphaproteobacteria bacterium]
MSFPPSHPALDSALRSRGYETPTPVQKAVLEAAETAGPLVDLLVSAQTGSGKTVAFGLAMASSLLGSSPDLPPASAPLALIIAPTRELAMQISRELAWLYANTGARIAHCVGGMDARREQRALADGAHIVVGTPGRIRDHLERGYLNLSELSVVVLDEADEMLDLGFREELEFILEAAPEGRRTLLFSATIARGIALLARRFQRDAVRIDTTSHSEPHRDIEYRILRVAPQDVDRAVVNVLRFFEAPGALVFCSTREAVRRLHGFLRDRGFSAVGLSGELSQRERTDALQSLRDGRARVCVATDVAARGLDLPDLGIVIHADPPTNKAALLHRSGRTGRAGRKGVSVLMVPPAKRRRTEQVLASANIEATWSEAPSRESILSRDRLRLLENPALSETPAEEDVALGQMLLERVDAVQIAATLMRVFRGRLPEPEDLAAAGRFSDPQALPRARKSPDGAEPSERRPRRERNEGAAWFRLNSGRKRGADPKWLVPLICRLGRVEKKDIGAIRIFETETRFEIIGEAIAGFTSSVADTASDETRILPCEPPSGDEERAPPRPRREREAGSDRSSFTRPAYPARAPSPSHAATPEERTTPPETGAERAADRLSERPRTDAQTPRPPQEKRPRQRVRQREERLQAGSPEPANKGFNRAEPERARHSKGEPAFARSPSPRRSSEDGKSTGRETGDRLSKFPRPSAGPGKAGKSGFQHRKGPSRKMRSDAPSASVSAEATQSPPSRTTSDADMRPRRPREPHSGGRPGKPSRPGKGFPPKGRPGRWTP